MEGREEVERNCAAASLRLVRPAIRTNTTATTLPPIFGRYSAPRPQALRPSVYRPHPTDKSAQDMKTAMYTRFRNNPNR